MKDKINQKKNKNNTFLSIFLITFNKHPSFFLKNFVYSCFLATFAILYRGM